MFNYKTYIEIKNNKEYKIIMTQPYANIKILDLTHVLAGPFATYQFALLGADVIKIEEPNSPDCARGRGPDAALNADLLGLNYQVQAANKKAMTLDLKSARGQQILKQLVEDADILVENYRTGALSSLGLGYDDLKAVNPKLIYCSLTGFGNSGPRAEVNAYDNVIQASSGIIDQSGGHKPGVSFVDYAAGYNAAFAISSALHQREATGKGTHISCSMLEVAMNLMAPEAAAAQHPVKVSRDKEAGISAYDTKNGILMMGAFTHHQNRRMWECLMAQEYDISDTLYAPTDWQSLWAVSNDIKIALSEILKDKTASEWQDIFHGAGLPAERQRPLAEAVNDPQLSGYFEQVDGVTLPKSAYHFEDGAKITAPPPGFSEHTNAILMDLGMSASEIEQLRKDGVIA
tara:strand:+ start:67306 stop:68514 length:1209 start_codon:yes stop_codon:yes gene_type:complete